MKTVTRRWFVGVCASALWVSACLSPTLPPLPPPSEPEMHYEAAGELRLQGVVSAKDRRVTVLAVNNHSGAVGGRVIRDGKYSFLIEAEPGDEIELWYEVGLDVSDSLFLEAPPFDPTDLPDAGPSTLAADADAGSDSGAEPEVGTAPEAGTAPDAAAETGGGAGQ